ncbi:MAG: ARPP-1 family domain-containing protein [Saprospiraceae bacterium]
MKSKHILLFSLLALAACKTETSDQNQTTSQPQMSGIQIDRTDNPEWRHENLRLYPLVADAAFVAGHAAAGNYIGLKDAMAMPKFRIVEKKPFGRFDDHGAVNMLTVENRSNFPVFLMSGDVVKGGNQDRIIAEDMVVPPVAIADAPVFCVEQGRWQYREEDAGDEAAKKVYAFKGYYNVASGELRRTVKETKNQNEVWAKVGDITSANDATNGTSAYTGLEGSEAFVEARGQYLRYFEGKFGQVENMVGVLAVNGDQIIGADVFAHPDLFQKQFPALLHSYVTDAVTHKNTGTLSDGKLDGWLYGFEQAWKKKGDSDTKFYDQGMMIHFSHFSR